MPLTLLLFLRKLKRSPLPAKPDSSPRRSSHSRSPHQLSAPAVLPFQIPLPPNPSQPAPAVLPCGCSRSHVLVQKLDTIPQSPDSYPGLTSRFSSSSSGASLHRSLSDFTFNFPFLEEDPSPQFHYYLPHLSTSTTDFYTECEWVAYDVNDANEHAETVALLFASPEDVELPCIDEEDFDYYPEIAELPYTDLDEGAGLEGKVAEKKERRRLKKKGAWEEFWLESRVGALVRKFEGMGLKKMRWRFRPWVDFRS